MRWAPAACDGLIQNDCLERQSAAPKTRTTLVQKKKATEPKITCVSARPGRGRRSRVQ